MTTLSLMIQEITEVILVEQIYSFTYQNADKKVQQLFVIIRNIPGQGVIDSLALCKLILQKSPGYTCYVSFPSEINKKIKQGNIRTLLICHPDNLIYQHSDTNQLIDYPKVDFKLLPAEANNFFEKSIDKMLIFEEGYSLYLKKGYLPQAGFMLHQMLELGYRAAENILIGKEKISHSLKKHQLYLHPFCTEIGTLFLKQHETSVLEKLDEVYIAARYDLDFSLSKEELFIAFAKHKEMIAYLIHSNMELQSSIKSHPQYGRDIQVKCKKFHFSFAIIKKKNLHLPQ